MKTIPMALGSIPLLGLSAYSYLGDVGNNFIKASNQYLAKHVIVWIKASSECQVKH